MKRLFIILSIILLINSYYANSQIEYSVDKWMEYVEELALETEDTERNRKFVCRFILFN